MSTLTRSQDSSNLRDSGFFGKITDKAKNGFGYVKDNFDKRYGAIVGIVLLMFIGAFMYYGFKQKEEKAINKAITGNKNQTNFCYTCGSPNETQPQNIR